MALVMLLLIGVLLLFEVAYVVTIMRLPSGLAGTDFDSDTVADLGYFGSAFGGVSAFFAGIGFAGIATTIYFQHKEFQYQVDLLQRSYDLQNNLSKSQIVSTSRMRLYDLSKYFMEYPQYRQYFYEGEDVPRQKHDFTRVYTMAEMFVDGMDDLLEGEDYAPDATDWVAWKIYFWDIYQASPIIRQYYEKHRDWYGDSLRTIVEGKRPKETARKGV
jgi:hypothetical protein